MTGSGPTAYHWLSSHAELAPTAPALTVCREGRGDEGYSSAELLDLADRVAAWLRDRDVSPGDRVLLSLPNDASFPAVLLGCLAIGAIAVPAPVPGISRADAFRERIAGIVGDSTPHLIVTTAQWAALVAEAVGTSAADPVVTAWETLTQACPQPEAAGTRPEAADADPDGIAVLQYTSGSTKRPRGVMVTHAMLAANCGQAAAAYQETVADRAVTWVPLYHDMGLITGLMRPLYAGYESVLLGTDRFARSPASWLRTIEEHRATLSSAPNFAYDLCVRKVSPEMAESFDLGTWRVARNAGEVVRPETLDRFTARFAGAGLRPDVLCPSYGLAEATLTVTTCGPGRPAIRVTACAQDLVPGGHVAPMTSAGGQPTDSGAPGTPGSGIVLQSSGVPLAGTHVYVDGETAERRVGRLSVAGPQASPGYWPKPRHADGSAERLRLMETGDLGFRHQGHIFVLGRVDDTIVRHGRNYFASDVSAVCAGVSGVRPGRVAVFTTAALTTTAATHETTGQPADQVVVVAELSADADLTAPVLARRELEIRDALGRALDLYVARVAFLPAGLLPVTTSGKVRTAEVCRRLEDGSLPLLGGTAGESGHSGNGAS